MKFMIYAPGMPITPDVLENRSLGGSESAAAYLAAALKTKDPKHDVVVFSHTQQIAQWRGVHLLPIGQPTQACPLGQQFEAVASAIPHDVLLVQRVWQPFPRRYAARYQGWWVHDLVRRRQEAAFKHQAWACDGVFAVSDWHARQVSSTLRLDPRAVSVLRNGVDVGLFTRTPSWERKLRRQTLVYTSRPERGLENLLKPGGVMERLKATHPDALLQVATYDNPVHDFAELYARLMDWGRKLGNVEFLPPLSKRGVADLMTDATVLVYPTVPAQPWGDEPHQSGHEETSCISVMEAQCGGTPVIACDGGAVRETLGNGIGNLVPYAPDGATDIETFTQCVKDWLDSTPEHYEQECAAARERGLSAYSIEAGGAVDALELLAATTRTGQSASGGEARARPPHSYPRELEAKHLLPELAADKIIREQLRGELRVYAQGWTPELPLRPVDALCEKSAGANVLLLDEWLHNFTGDDRELSPFPKGALICCAAVLRAPEDHFLAPLAIDLDAFEQEYGAVLPEFDLVCCPPILDEQTGTHAQVGWVTWRQGEPVDVTVRRHSEKRETLSALMIVKNGTEIQKTLEPLLQVCDEVVIGVDCAGDIAYDGELPEYWRDLAWVSGEGAYGVKTFLLDHRPLIDGFAAARNEVLDKCTKDWVLWIDADETLTYPLRLPKYLRQNTCTDGYALEHQHVSSEPPIHLKADLPMRLFRRDAGLRFTGLVHEHPLHAPDKAPTFLTVIGDVKVFHPGYLTDAIRKARFERNWPLMVRDQVENPDRTLGQVLMLRDLAQRVRFDLMAQLRYRPLGPQLSPEHLAMVDRGLALWETILKKWESNPDLGLFIEEALQFVTELSLLKRGVHAVRFNHGFDFLSEGIGHCPPDARPMPRDVQGALPTADDVARFLALSARQKLRTLSERYL